jgi:hypothetical protein
MRICAREHMFASAVTQAYSEIIVNIDSPFAGNAEDVFDSPFALQKRIVTRWPTAMRPTA